MKTRKHKQKGRGILQSKPTTRKSVQFFIRNKRNHINNSNNANTNKTKPWNQPGYLEELKSVLKGVLPPVANVHQHNAEIMGALLESYNNPEDMYEMIDLIYNYEPLTPQEQEVLKPYTHNKVPKEISRLAASNLPPDVKRKLLNFYRRFRARQKIHHLYEKKHEPKVRYIHPEWNLPKNTE